METEAEVRAQLERMVEEDPLGKEAVALLPSLMVFSGPFENADVIPVLKGEITTAPSQLLKVLKAWGFLEQPDKNHFRLIPHVAEIIPTATHSFERLFHYYYTRYMRVDSDRYERLDAAWPNLARTLLWGLTHQPENAFDFALALQPYMATHIPLAEWKHITQTAFEIRRDRSVLDQAQIIKALGDVAFFEHDLGTARQRYEEALQLYETLPRESSLWMATSEYFSDYLEQFRPDSYGPYIYKRVYAWRAWRDVVHLFIFYDLIIVAMIQGDHDGVKHFAHDLLTLYRWREPHQDENHNDQGAFLMSLALWSQRRQQLDLARYFYGHALEHYWWTTEGFFNVLWAWGRLEHTIGQKEAGSTLCQLSLTLHTDYVSDFPPASHPRQHVAQQRVIEELTQRQDLMVAMMSQESYADRG